jgi:hypothetical protein
VNKQIVKVIVMAITPYITVITGGVVAWLYTHVGLFDVFHVTKDRTASTLTALIVFGVTALLSYLTAHTKLFPELIKWAEAEDLQSQPVAAQKPAG